MKKLLVTLDIGDYLPEITKITFPMMRTWAHKIGAEFRIITERVLTKEGDGKPLNYEKFQIKEIAEQYDWTYFLDSDAFIHPDTPDWPEMAGDKSLVYFSGLDNRTARFRASIYSRRSASNAGACTWNVICSDWTSDLWTAPKDYEAAVKNITPIWDECKSGYCSHTHLIDDYQLSENIARFGLKVRTINDICREMNLPLSSYHHLYNCDPYTKLKAIRGRLDEMGVQYA